MNRLLQGELAPVLAPEPRGVVLSFALALAIGALIGVEREAKKRAGEPSFAGLRTFALIAEAGAIAAWLARELATPWLFVGAGALVTALLLTGHLVEVRTRPEAIGLTTEVAGLVTFLLGGLVLFGHAELAVALAIATTAVLAFKEPLHGLVDRIGREDLQAALKLLIATFIVLPVLPDRPVDPWGVLNPYSMWWLVILISTLSLAGYAATRALGQGHGLVLTGLAGGLVSSTAVTLGFARQSRERGHASVEAMAAGLLLAWAVMFVRVGVAVALVHRPLLAPLAVPLGAMGAAAVVAAGVAYLRARRAAGDERAPDVKLRNPFRLTASIRFALFFAATLLVVELVRRWLPEGGLYAVAALAGLTDVDAITLSVAELARGGTALGLAAGAIVVAALANTLVKCGLVVVLGSAALRRPTLQATVLVLVAGGLALILT
ncbi:MAG TPA: MgtC/SapB family protein [Planctomycetota bacterium]